MSRKRKYSNEFRLKIVEEYLSGKSGGIKLIAHKYGIAHSDVSQWAHLYIEGGYDALTKVPGSYDGKYKIHIVEYMHQNCLSLRQTAAKFGIADHKTIGKWEKIYLQEGKEALMEERRGKSLKLPPTNKDDSSRVSINSNEDLLAEVQRLRMENEYLKKLIALTQEREKEEQKTK